MNTYKTEFPPEFHAIPEFVTGDPRWIDTSWHNDAAPSFELEAPGVHLRLWVHPENPADREMLVPRFGLFLVVDPESSADDFGLWAGDDEQTLRTAVSSYVGPAPIKGEER